MGFGVFFVPSPEFRNGQLNPQAYPPVAVFVALFVAITILWSAWGTRIAIPYLPRATVRIRLGVLAIPRQVVLDVVAAVRCGSFRWLFLGVLILFIIIGVDSARARFSPVSPAL